MSDTAPNLSIRARPRAVRRFSRKALLGGSVLLGTIMFGALAVALQSPSYDDEMPDELYNVTHKPIADGLERLSKSYAEYKPAKPKLGPPLPGDLGAAYLASADLPPNIVGATPKAKIRPTRPARLASYPAPPANQAPQAAPIISNGPESLFFNVGRRSCAQIGPSANLEPSILPNPLSSPLSGLEFPQAPSFNPQARFEFGSVTGDRNQQARKEAFIDTEDSDIYNSHGLVSRVRPIKLWQVISFQPH